MFRRYLINLSAAGLLAIALPVYAGNDAAPPAPPQLDVTMNVVPLNSNIEKSVAHTIVLPLKKPDTKLPVQSAQGKQAASAKHPAANPPAASDDKTDAASRKSILHEAAEAREEATEAAKEAQKDRDNSGAEDNDSSSGGG